MAIRKNRPTELRAAKDGNARPKAPPENVRAAVVGCKGNAQYILLGWAPRIELIPIHQIPDRMIEGDPTDRVLTAISQAPSRRALWQVMLTFAERHGITMVSRHSIYRDRTDLQIATEGFPEEFWRRYQPDNLAKIDPAHALGMRMGTPFQWRDIGKLTDLTNENKDFLPIARAQGAGQQRSAILKDCPVTA